MSHIVLFFSVQEILQPQQAKSFMEATAQLWILNLCFAYQKGRKSVIIYLYSPYRRILSDGQKERADKNTED